MDKALITTINENRDRLNNVSKEIWANPEGSFEEKPAHDTCNAILHRRRF